MFNKKLKLKNERLKEKIEEQKKEIEEQRNIIEQLRQDLELPLPKGCKKGDYCSACIYGKIKAKGGSYFALGDVITYYVCTKNCCREFVEKQ